jgi:hypothetical protein
MTPKRQGDDVGERPASVPRKTKDSLDQALDLLASLRNKQERLDAFFDSLRNADHQQQDWRNVRVALAEIELLIWHARRGVWYRRGGTDKLGELDK